MSIITEDVTLVLSDKESMDDKTFGALGVFAGGISFPESNAIAHPLHLFMQKCSDLLAALYSVESDEKRDTLLTELTALTMDAGVGSMVGQSTAEALASVRSWMRKSKLGFGHQPVKKEMTMWADLAREDIFYKKVACMVLSFERCESDARKPEYYFGPQLDKELNCFQLTILFLIFLKINVITSDKQVVEESKIELVSDNELLQFKVSKIQKVLEVMVVGKHYFMSPECISRLASFLGECEKLRTKRVFDGELIDDLWQIVNTSCCMTTVLKHMHAQDAKLFDMQSFSLYFGPMGLADSHVFDIPLLLLNGEEFAVYGESEMMALGTAAMAMGDSQVLELSALFEPFPALLNSLNFVEDIKEYFKDDATCTMNMMIAKFFSSVRTSVPKCKLIYSSRPQISVEFFHNRQAFLRPEGFVVLDISAEKVNLNDSFDEDGLFVEYPKEKFMQGLIKNGKLIVRGAKFLRVVHLQGDTPVIDQDLNNIKAGDMLIASYEDGEFNEDFVIEAFAPNEPIRAKFLLISAMLNSKFSKNAIYMLIQ